VLYLNRCTRADIDAILDAGLELHFVYETNPTYEGYFTWAQGRADANACIAMAAARGLPTATVVYLTVDVNLDPVKTIPYFNAADPLLAASPVVGGVYGFQSMIDFARHEFGNLGKHLWQTYGIAQGTLDLWQTEQRPECGITVDVNQAYVAGWRKAVSAPILQNQSPDLHALPVATVGVLSATFKYPSGRIFSITKKVVEYDPEAERKLVYIYPPIDPDADETLALDCEPAVFVVDVVAP